MATRHYRHGHTTFCNLYQLNVLNQKLCSVDVRAVNKPLKIAEHLLFISCYGVSRSTLHIKQDSLFDMHGNRDYFKLDPLKEIMLKSDF